jgi:Spy/CpxP family protein refolding chaperone
MKHILTWMIALGIILTAAAALAQEGGGPMARPDDMFFDNGPGREGPPSEAQREQVRKKIEAVRMWRLTEELKLDEKTALRLSSFLSSIQEKRRDLTHKAFDTVKDVRASLKTAKPDTGRLKIWLDQLEKNHREISELKQKELSGLKDILTVEQQARYLIFESDFQNEIRKMIAGARGGGPMRGGMPPGAGNNSFGNPLPPADSQ